jgi:hypothetical protein
MAFSPTPHDAMGSSGTMIQADPARCKSRRAGREDASWCAASLVQ